MDRVLRSDGKVWEDAHLVGSGLYGIASAPSGDAAIIAFDRDEYGPHYSELITLGKTSTEVRAVALELARALDEERLPEAAAAIHAAYQRWYDRRFQASLDARRDHEFVARERGAALAVLRSYLKA